MRQHPNGIYLQPRNEGSIIRRPDLPARSVGHTTETPSGTAFAVARNLLWPYHNLVDIGERKIYNLISWDRAALSLKGSYATRTGAETNHAGRANIQWSIVGYAGDMGNLGKGDLRWLAEEFIEPMLRLNKIPNVYSKTYGPQDNIVLASVNSPIRMSDTQWLNYSGVTWHQTVPGQDHWDAGKIDWAGLYAYVNNERPISLPERDKPVTIPGMNSVLQFGDRGQEVTELQQLIKGFFPKIGEHLVVDGHFNKQTRSAVRAAQRKLKVTVDGFWSTQSALAFRSYKREIGNAIAAGIKNTEDDATDDERIDQTIDRQDQVIDEAREKLEDLEQKFARLYKLVGNKDHPALKGMIQLIQDINDDLKTIERTNTRLSKLTE